MIRYVHDFGGYFVEHFRRTEKRLEARPTDGPPLRISLCTTCMNRLHDLSLTLPANITDNEDYPDVEFVLLDYASTDGLGDWVKANMSRHLESGRLVYYRVDGQPTFRRSHSRNVSFKLATGRVVVNVDADNYVHPGFVAQINRCAAAAERKALIVPHSFLNPHFGRLFLRGRFGLYRDDLIRLGGFDEDFDDGYSQEDAGFVMRCLLDRFTVVRFDDRFLRDRIVTSDEEKLRHSTVKSLTDIKADYSKAMQEKLARCEIVANRGRAWGGAVVTKNFSEVLKL